MSDVLLLSGGIDSLAAWFYCNQPQSIYVDLQTKYSAKELKCLIDLQKIEPSLKPIIVTRINLGQFETKGSSAYIPYRNLILASIASNYGDKIILAGIEDDNVEDKNPVAFEIMENCLNSIGKTQIKLYSPFWHHSKSDIMGWMLEHISNAERLIKTSVSCYTDSKGSCGNCPSCLRKAVAMSVVGLTVDCFENDVTQSNLIPAYISKMQAGEYSQKRTMETLRVFRNWGWSI